MRIRLHLATPEDVPELVDLRTAVNERLRELFGEGYWYDRPTEKGALLGMRRGKVYIARLRGRIAASLTLSARKPWAIDRSYFTPVNKPLYLTAMAVAPELQRKGMGRQCLDESRRIALAEGAESICLDAWDCPAGAAPFYAKCGWQERGRTVYRVAPLIYYETLLVP